MIRKNNIIVRPAESTDNLYEMSRLIYKCDPYIYPFWKSSESEFAAFLEPWMRVDGFFYNYRNFYIAHEASSHFPVGVFATINNHQPDFDYDLFIKHNQTAETKFIIEHYLRPICEEARNTPAQVAYGTVLSIHEKARGRSIGSILFNGGIALLKERGFDTLCFDCLEDNPRARALYEKCGFEVVSHGIGFDGTEHSKVKIVNYSASF